MLNPIALSADASTIGGILSMVGEMVTKFIEWMGLFLNFCTDNPIILIFLMLTLVGAAIGYLTRIMRSVG